jgi:hypothetical protein
MKRLAAICVAVLANPVAAARVDIGAVPATGPAVTCVEESGLQLVTTDSPDWLVLRQGSNTWRAALIDGCPRLGRNRIIARINTQGRLCFNDLVAVIDPVGGMNHGQCRIGRIEPVTIPRGVRF